MFYHSMRFINPVHVLPIQSSPFFITCPLSRIVRGIFNHASRQIVAGKYAPFLTLSGGPAIVIRLIQQQGGNGSGRRESVRKGLNTTSGAQLAALPLVKPVV